MATIRNRYLEAFKEGPNVVALATAAAASVALFNPLPLLIGVVAEAAYLMFYADSRWYAVRLARRFDAEVEARREAFKKQIFPTLSPNMQARFIRLEDVRADIDRQAQDDAQWFREVLRKLDFLLEKFLHFAAKEAQFRDYLKNAREEARQNPDRAPQRPQLNNVRGGMMGSGTPTNATGRPMLGRNNPPLSNAPQYSTDAADRWVQETIAEVQSHFDAEINALQARAQNESDSVTRAVLEKRLDVMSRRREFVGKIGRIHINLTHQLSLVEDTFGLISDELRARPPEQVLADIEDVVSQTNTMTQLLEEVAPLEQLLAS
jgi:hypothetical protein